MTVETFTPAVSGDDGYWFADGTFNSGSNDLRMGKVTSNDGTRVATFVRFPSVSIPAGSTLNAAKLTFEARSNGSTSGVTMTIAGELAASPSAPTTAADADGRTKTTASVAWDIETWTAGTDYDSPDFTAVLQEIIDQGTWAGGNAVIIYVLPNAPSSSSVRTAESYDSVTVDRTLPTLTVDYTAPATPTAPSGLSGAADSDTAITWTWTDNADDEDNIVLEVDDNDAFSSPSEHTLAANTTTYQSTGLTEGATYYARVKATNAGGDSAWSSTANASTQLAAPSGLSGSADSDTAITWTWTDNSANEGNIELQVDDNDSFSSPSTHTLAASTATYQSTSLTAETTYYARVRAVDDTIPDSDWSSTVNVTTLAPGVVQISPSTNDGYFKDSGTFSNDQTFIDMGNTSGSLSNGFFRFPAVDIPAGATVLSATLSVRSRENTSDAVVFDVRAVAEDDPVAPISAADASGRALTTASVAWQPGAWVQHEWYSPPDVSALVQEIVDRPGWASGNAMLMYILEDGSGLDVNRRIHASEEPVNAPNGAQLAVEFSVGSGGLAGVDVPGVRYRVRVVTGGRSTPIVVVGPEGRPGASDPVEVVEDPRAIPVRTDADLVVGNTYRVRFGKG